MIADDLLKRNLEEMKKIFGRLSTGDRQKDSMRRIIADTEAYLAEYAEPQAVLQPKKSSNLSAAEIMKRVRSQKDEQEQRRQDAIEREMRRHEYIYGPQPRL